MRRISTAELQRMHSHSFEHFIAELWERLGYETRVTRQGKDAGIDVVATRETDEGTERILIQAKRYGPSTKVGGPEIQQYAGLRAEYPNSKVIVVTSSDFTRPAYKRAKRTSVDVYNGQSLLRLVRRADAEDVLANYSPSVSTEDEEETEKEETTKAESESSSSHSPGDYEKGDKREISDKEKIIVALVITTVLLIWFRSLAVYGWESTGIIFLFGSFLLGGLLLVWIGLRTAARKLLAEPLDNEHHQ